MNDKEKQNYEQQYPEEEFERQQFTFSKGELTLLNSYETLKMMGEMANALINNLLNNVCLPRVNHDPKNEIGLYYSNTEGIFTVYKPKHYCEVCKKRAGRHLEDKKYYCNECLYLKKVREKESV